MKTSLRFYSLAVVGVLSACNLLPASPAQQAESRRVADCYAEADLFKKTNYSQMLSVCIDQPQDFQAYKENYIRNGASPLELCNVRDKQGSELAASVISKKHVNCSTEVRRNAEEKISTLSIPDLCSTWYSREGMTQLPAYRQKIVAKALDDEIASRHVNCSQVAADLQQQQIQENAVQLQAQQNAQMIALRRQEMMQQQNQFYLQQQQNNLNQMNATISANRPVIANPTRTNCQQFGNQVNCTTY